MTLRSSVLCMYLGKLKYWDSRGYRNDCISCLPDLITALELVTALDSTEKILLVTLLYH